MISPDKIKALSFVEQLIQLETTDSTNTYAKGLAALPASGCAVICADTQMAGRGRGDNVFFSRVRGGLYASIVCFVQDIADHFACNRAMSLAICDSIQNRFESCPLFIKWPNDIYWQDRKVCGILLETIPGQRNHIVIGIGVNVNLKPDDFPHELRNTATSILIETGMTIDIHDLLYDILTLFWNYGVLPRSEVHSLYCDRLYKPGAAVEINGQKGTFAGVREDGCLCLKKVAEMVYLVSGTLRYS
jgi:BirA family biotin operon repressor/biotin-[acetyl-CoA-carboxylase] ligase